jgi:hypothetical protein
MLPTGCTARSGEMEKEFPSKRPISSNCYTTYYSHTLESRAQTRYAQEVQGWGEPHSKGGSQVHHNSVYMS